MEREEAHTAPAETNIHGDVNTAGGLFLAGNINTGGGDFVGRDKIIIQRIDPDDARNQRNHAALRQMVRSFWIDGVLMHSLYREALIRLQVAARADLVDNRPWNLILQRPDLPDTSLPDGNAVIDIFDSVGQHLLILGEPGAGKTTMLLELADALLTRAANDPTHPTPVIFNLSSWAAVGTVLDAWMVAELREKYNIPEKVAQAWVKNDELLPLMDGLDEVQEIYRDACATAINTFRQEHLTPLAVCCRIAEYQRLDQQLKLQGAVLLQPLTEAQIDAYLQQVGPSLQSLRKTLANDAELQELARSPIMLNILSLTYQASAPDDLTPQAGQSPRQRLFTAYLRRMFLHREGGEEQTPGQTLRWLRWLAGQLAVWGQTFLIEGLQPGWLGDKDRSAYLWLSRLLHGLLLGLLSGLAYGLIAEMYFSYQVYTDGRIEDLQLYIDGSLPRLLVLGVVTGLCVGLVTGSTLALLDILRFAPKDGKDGHGLTLLVRRLTASSRRTGLFYGLVCALLSSLVGGLIGGQLTDKVFTFTGSLIFGLAFGLVFGLRAPKQTISNDIQTVDAFSPSPLGFFKGLGLGLAAGLLFGITSGLLVWLYLSLNNDPFGLGAGVARGLFLALGMGQALGLGGALYWGLGIKNIETGMAPNQGIRLSINNGILAGVMTTLLGVLLFGAIYGIFFGGIGVSIALTIGGGFGGLATLWYGGFDALQHGILRIILWHGGYMPWHYARFLNSCVHRIFLHRVGGGYVFVHRLLMEHIATLSDDDIQRITAGLDTEERTLPSTAATSAAP